jgi:hypothetical protein
MAKASIKTKGGATIVVEGSPEEVAKLIRLFEDGPTERKEGAAKNRGQLIHNSKTSPTNLINSLIDGGFFKKPKDLSEVKHALEELGHVYPVTSLSPALLRLVRQRQLRRLKDKKRWLYTG